MSVSENHVWVLFCCIHHESSLKKKCLTAMFVVEKTRHCRRGGVLFSRNVNCSQSVELEVEPHMLWVRRVG